MFPGRHGIEEQGVTWAPSHEGTLVTAGHSSQVSLSSGKGVQVHNLPVNGQLRVVIPRQFHPSRSSGEGGSCDHRAALY